ncbi:MAG TPA: DoxX family protein [Solirubrobacteraceae bacterium]
MNLALLVLHVVIGAVFLAHGTQKIFGWFGGPGVATTAGFFENIGLRPGRVHAWAAALAETIGGLLLALGLFTPIGSALVIAVMTAAIITVHGTKGFFNTDGGYEFNLTLIAAAFALAGLGPGQWSLDNVVGLDWHGTSWALIALGAGLLGGIAAVLQGHAVSATPGDRVRPTAA